MKAFNPNKFFVDGKKYAVINDDTNRWNMGKCSLEPNYDKHCSSCSQSPTVGTSGMCGACFFGEADCIDPNNW